MKAATKEEKDYMRRVAELGCLICGRPSEVHHCGTYMGGGRDNKSVISLCPGHHRNGGYGIAIHAGKKKWEKVHGTEQSLLELTEKKLRAG